MSTHGEFTIQAELHTTGRWITVPLVVGGRRTLAAVLDTGSPVSAISPQTHRRLLTAGLLLPAVGRDRHRLMNLSVAGQPLPPLEIAIIRRLDRLDVDAVLGLDFLAQFATIHFDTRTFRLVLGRM